MQVGAADRRQRDTKDDLTMARARSIDLFHTVAADALEHVRSHLDHDSPPEMGDRARAIPKRVEPAAPTHGNWFPAAAGRALCLARRTSCAVTRPFEPVSFVMDRRMLLGIKERAERARDPRVAEA
jgi:hypothetical protein